LLQGRFCALPRQTHKNTHCASMARTKQTVKRQPTPAYARLSQFKRQLSERQKTKQYHMAASAWSESRPKQEPKSIPMEPEEEKKEDPKVTLVELKEEKGEELDNNVTVEPETRGESETIHVSDPPVKLSTRELQCRDTVLQLLNLELELLDDIRDLRSQYEDVERGLRRKCSFIAPYAMMSRLPTETEIVNRKTRVKEYRDKSDSWEYSSSKRKM